MNNEIENMPDHQKRYLRAWLLYKDEDWSEEEKTNLENEMDNAQNDFGWDEFHEFKHKLPGFVEHWEGLREDFLSKLT